jgi:hypothetical protein
MKPTGLVETELGPLIQAAFERHQAIQVDHHRGRRQIEQHEGQQPEDDVRRSELSRDADPREPDDEEDLREGEIADAELLLQRRAVRLDARLGLCESRRRRGRFEETMRQGCLKSCARLAKHRPVARPGLEPLVQPVDAEKLIGRVEVSSAVEKEKKTVSRFMWRLNSSAIGTVPPIRTTSGFTP